jgi:hypothetical protein
LAHWTKPFSPAREGRLKPKPDINAASIKQRVQKSTANLHAPEKGRMTMIRPLLVVAVVALVSAAPFAQFKSTPPMLLSNADGVEWTCSKSALILTTCAPNRDDRNTSLN